MNKVLRYCLLIGMSIGTINGANFSERLASAHMNQNYPSFFAKSENKVDVLTNQKIALKGILTEIEKYSKERKDSLLTRKILDGSIDNKLKVEIFRAYFDQKTKIKEYIELEGVKTKQGCRVLFHPILGLLYQTSWDQYSIDSMSEIKNPDILKDKLNEAWGAFIVPIGEKIKSLDKDIEDAREAAKKDDEAGRQTVSKAVDSGLKAVEINIEAAAKGKSLKDAVKVGVETLIKDGMTKKNATLVGGTLTTVGVTCILSWHLLGLTFKYAEKYINAPTLIKKSSIPTNMTDWFLYKTGYGTKEESRLDEFKAPDHLKDDLINSIEQTQQAKEIGIPFKNILLYGPPGTGKTMFAEILAIESGLEYAMFSGADFNNFEKLDEAIIELESIIKWAENSKKGILVFVDEAESFLRDRRFPDANLRSCALTEKFLSMVAKPSSDKIMWVFATNNLGAFDFAAESRIAESFEMLLPTKEACCEIFFDALAKMDIIADEELKQNFYVHSHLFKGFSGRSTEEVGFEVARILSTSDKELGVDLFVSTINKTCRKNSSFKKEQIKYQKARYGNVITEIDLESVSATA